MPSRSDQGDMEPRAAEESPGPRSGKRRRMVSMGRIIECASWSCMSAIHWPAVDAVVRLRRQGIEDLVGFATGLDPAMLPRFAVPVDAASAKPAVAAAVAQRLTTPGRGRRWLIADIVRLARAFLELVPGQRAKLRLDPVTTTGEVEFAVADVRVRLVASYRGPGLQWLPDTAADPSAITSGKDAALCRDPSVVRTLPAGGVALFKGTRHTSHTDGGGLIHRLPPSAETAGLILTIDPADDLPWQ